MQEPNFVKDMTKVMGFKYQQLTPFQLESLYLSKYFVVKMDFNEEEDFFEIYALRTKLIEKIEVKR